MKCSRCLSESYERPGGRRGQIVDRAGVTFRLYDCTNCGHVFMTAELVVNGEHEPVALLDSVLKQVMDESDERVQEEIEAAESLELLAEEELTDDAI